MKNQNFQANSFTAQSYTAQLCKGGLEQNYLWVSTGVITDNAMSGFRKDGADRALDGQYASIYQVPLSLAVSRIGVREGASQMVSQPIPQLRPKATPQSSPNIIRLKTSAKSCETFTVSLSQLPFKDPTDPGKSITLPLVPITPTLKANKSTQAILPTIISVDASISSITLPLIKHQFKTRKIWSDSVFVKKTTLSDMIKDIFKKSTNLYTHVVCDDVFEINDDTLEKIIEDNYNYNDTDEENRMNSLINGVKHLSFNNHYTVYRAEITDDQTDKYELVIADWVSDLPLKEYDILGRKVEKDNIFMTFISKLTCAANNTDYDKTRMKADIIKILDVIPLEINRHSSKRVFIHKLANVLVNNILKLNIFFNGESSNGGIKRFYPTKGEMSDFVITEMSDFIDNYHSEINLNSIIDIEDELVDILINFTESIRDHDIDLVSEEIVALLRDSGGLFEHQAIYLASVMLEHLMEIFRLVEESTRPLQASESHKCQTYVMTNHFTKISPNKITNPIGNIDTHHTDETNADVCIQQLSRQIEEWLDSLPVQIMQNREDSFIQVLIHDLATDIIDRQKYVEINTKDRNVNADFENLKFQIFKWMNRLSEDSSVPLEHAGDLMQRIQKVTDVHSKQNKEKSSNLFGKAKMLSRDLKVLPLIESSDPTCCKPKPPLCCEPVSPKCCKEKMGAIGMQSQYSSEPTAMQGQYAPGPSGIQAQYSPRSSGMQGQYGPGPSGMQVQFGPGPRDMPGQYGLGPSEMQDQYGPGPSGMQGQEGMNQQFDTSESIQMGKHDPRVFDPEPDSLPPGMTIQDVNDEYDEFLKEWVQQIPIEAKTAEEKQITELMRKGIYNGVWKTIAKLKGNVELMKNKFYYEDVFDGEIEELFSMLPQTQDLLADKPRLKVNLTEKTGKLNEMIRHYVAPDAFKENLIEKANSYIPRVSFDLKGENAVKLAEDIEVIKLVDEFILSTRYQDEDPVKANVHRRKLLAHVQKLVQHLKENHGKELADITPEVYVNDLLLALQQVPKPDQSIVSEQADSVLMQMEVAEWAKDLPLQPHENPKEHMTRRRQMDKLAQKLHEMEKSLNLSDSNVDREVRHEISDFLDRMPMEHGATLNINFMVDELMNRMKSRKKQRDQKMGNYVLTPEGGYKGFSRDKPIASSFNESEFQHSGVTGEDSNWQTMGYSGKGAPMNASIIQPGQGMPSQFDGGQQMDSQPMHMIQLGQGRSQSMGGQPITGPPMMPLGQGRSQSMGGQPMGGWQMGGHPMSGQSTMQSLGQDMSQSLYIRGQPDSAIEDNVAWQTMDDSMEEAQMAGQPMDGQQLSGQLMAGQTMGSQPMRGQPMGRPGLSQSLGAQQVGGQPMIVSGTGMSQSMGGQPMGGQQMSGQSTTPSSGQDMSQSLYIRGQLDNATEDSVDWQSMADSRDGAQMSASRRGTFNQFMGAQPMGSRPMMQSGWGRSQSMGAQQIAGQPMMMPRQARYQSMGGQPMGGQNMGFQQMGDRSISGQPMGQSRQRRAQSIGGQQTGGPLMMPSRPQGPQQAQIPLRDSSLDYSKQMVQIPGSYRSFSFERPPASSFIETPGPNDRTNKSIPGGSAQAGGYGAQGFLQGGRQPMQGGRPMQRGTPMQGGIPMQRGTPMQGGFPIRDGSLMQGGRPMQGGSPAQQGMFSQGQPTMQAGGISRQANWTPPGTRTLSIPGVRSPTSSAQGKLSLIRETPMQDVGQQSGQPSIPSSVGLQARGTTQTRTTSGATPSRRPNSAGQYLKNGQASPEPKRVSIEEKDGTQGRDATSNDTFHTAPDQSSIQDESMPCHGKKICAYECCCPCRGGTGSVVQKCAHGKIKEKCTCAPFNRDGSGRSSSAGTQFFKSTDREGISHFTNQNRQPSRCAENCKQRIANQEAAIKKNCCRKSSGEESDHGKKCRCLERLKKYREQQQLGTEL